MKACAEGDGEAADYIIGGIVVVVLGAHEPAFSAVLTTYKKAETKRFHRNRGSERTWRCRGRTPEVADKKGGPADFLLAARLEGAPTAEFTFPSPGCGTAPRDAI